MNGRREGGTSKKIGKSAGKAQGTIKEGNFFMKSIVFKKLNAFSANGSSGNPAGAVYLKNQGDLSPGEMQEIARELKSFVSEVGFVAGIDAGRYWIRYYSSEREVNFCGHATIAILYDLIRNSPELLARKEVFIHTAKDELAVENRIPTEDCVFIQAPRPAFRPFADDREGLSGALGVETGDIRGDLPVSVVNAGLETLIVPVVSLKRILAVSPDLEGLKAYCIANGIDIVTLYSGEVSFSSNRFRTRVFAPTFGYLEDPATGSGNAAFGYYLLANRMTDGKPLSIEQNDSRDRPNIVKLSAREDEAGRYHVSFGGNALVKFEGTYYL